ncbi:MAG TPA: PH domain-containing protein [Candidatus Enterococcus stercoravium]|nr:PH domain-containing protein [Candidatus Enterococcus stercoravium]
MEYPILPKQMPARIKKVWQKSNLLATGIFVIIGAVVMGILIATDHFKGVPLWLIIGYFLLVLLLFIIRQFLIPYRYYFHRYEITPEDLAFQEGYLFRSITYVPINRIQHVETEQGPFLRKENLMEIVIHTAATDHHLAGLDMEEAMALRQQIIDMVKVAKEDV